MSIHSIGYTYLAALTEIPITMHTTVHKQQHVSPSKIQTEVTDQNENK